MHPRNEYMRNWRANNKDKVKAINKKWWHANKDFIKLKKELLCQEKQFLKIQLKTPQNQ